MTEFRRELEIITKSLATRLWIASATSFFGYVHAPYLFGPEVAEALPSWIGPTIYAGTALGVLGGAYARAISHCPRLYLFHLSRYRARRHRQPG